MAIKTSDELIEYFQCGAYPTDSNFVDLIDTATTASTHLVVPNLPNAGVARTMRNIVADYANPVHFGADGDGEANDSTAITTAAASGRGLLFSPGVYRVETGTLTAPMVAISPGASLSLLSGTYTIAAPIVAGRYRIFEGAGTIKLSRSEVLPEWFGAVGDGVTDDTVALLRAIAALPSSGGILRGDPTRLYRVASPLLLSSLTRVALIDIGLTVVTSHNYSEGGATVLGDLNHILIARSCQGMLLERLRIVCDTALFTVDNDNHGVFFLACSDIVMRDCDILPPRGDAVYVNSNNVSISKTLFRSPTRAGVRVGGGEHIDISDCHHSGGTSSSSVNGAFVDIRPVAGATIRDVVVDSNKSDVGSILVVSSNECARVKITDNILRQGAILLSGVEDVLVEGNDVTAVLSTDYAETYAAGIMLTPATVGATSGCIRRPVITGNTVRVQGHPTIPHPDRSGITIAASVDGTISNNTIINSGTVSHGIRLVSMRDTAVELNTVAGFVNAVISTGFGTFYDDSLTVQSSSKDILLFANDFRGRIVVTYAEHVNMTVEANQVRVTDVLANGGIRIQTDSNGRLEIVGNNVDHAGTNTLGAIDVNSSFSTTGQFAISANIVKSARTGIEVRTAAGSGVFDISHNHVVAATNPIEVNDNAIANVTHNSLRGVTTAIAFNAPTAGGRVAGNRLLSDFTTPFTSLSSSVDWSGQELSATASPGASGWANSQTWKLGTRFVNSSPAATGYVGWVCTVAGTPGTWKGYGVIQS